MIGDGEVSGGCKDPQLARRGLNHREDDSKVVLDTFACTTWRPQATIVVVVVVVVGIIIGIIIGARPVQGGRCWPIIGDS
jgi:hypothetical protein